MKRPLSSLLCVATAFGMVLPSACESTLSTASRGALVEGAVVSRLPSGSKRVQINGMTYYQSGANFFVRHEGQFVSVASPLSTLSAKQAITQPEGTTSPNALPNVY